MRRSLVRSLVAVATLVAVCPALAAAEAPSFTTVKLKGGGPGTEPRIIVGPDDRRYVVTNQGGEKVDGKDPRDAEGTATVYSSADGGRSFQLTPTTFGGQTAPTIDTDIVATRTGRVVTTELDTAGLNFPSAYSDDGGATWTNASGSNTLADQDRQWFAVGPDDPTTHKPTVYLLFHNLASGSASHNVYVAKSTDGGASFGAPVPSTMPGEDSFADMQCSDSGGPSGISVSATGQVYVFFTTRAAVPVPGAPDLGGCGASIFGPAQSNIVAGTRVWVATSKDASLGSWHSSLAVDDAPTNQIVSMQLAYGALDNRGGVWVAYPESPRAYPDYSGAAVKVVHADPALSKWSAPSTLIPAGGPGSLLVHLAVGDPGKLDVAYFRGADFAPGKKPAWYLHNAQTLDAGSATPTVTDQRVSDVPAYGDQTAGEMMGACESDVPAAGGVLGGYICSRSADVFGIALDARCRVSVTWPAVTTGNPAPGAAGGTYVSTQTAGQELCSVPAAGSGRRGRPGRGRRQRRWHERRWHERRRRQRHGHRSRVAVQRRLRPAGPPAGLPRCHRSRLPAPPQLAAGDPARAAPERHDDDRGCAADGTQGAAVKANVAKVYVAVGHAVAGGKCRYLTSPSRFGPPVSCLRTKYLAARGTSSWRFGLTRRLPRGAYVLWTRAVDKAGNVERKAAARNKLRFRVR